MIVSMITTVDHNVGDDFARAGILYLLKQKYPNITIRLIHKHIPVTVRNRVDWIYGSGLTRLLDRLPGFRGLYLSKLIDMMPICRNGDKIFEASLLVQSGAPVYWCHCNNHCADNEWYVPLIRKRYIHIKDRVPFVNIAAGTCQEYGSDGTELLRCHKCTNYIKEIHKLAVVTTVRDRLALDVLTHLGLDAPLIPCASIFARDYFGINTEEPEFVCLNYMEGGGHYKFSQDIDVARWESVFRKFYREIKNKFKCVFVCHDKKEVKGVRRIDSGCNIFYSPRYEDYLRFYARSKVGVMNRVHGAFAIASFGRPSFVVGTDTRARMVEEISLKHAFVNDITVKRLLKEFDTMVKHSEDYNNIFNEIKTNAYYEYAKALSRI